jgi:hypothetical protein
MEEYARLSPDLPAPVGNGPLAIVGGGPSLIDHLDELREFDGEIWAVNQTAQYLRSEGIDCYFYTVDPSDTVADFCEGKSVLHAHCSPVTFARANPCFKTTGHAPGPTSMIAGCLLGIKYGYTKIYLYGGDSSYGERTHTYRNEPVNGMIRVECGGPHITKIELLIQAERLAEIVKALPEFFVNRSGGLLGAMVENDDYDVTHAARDIHERMTHVVPEPSLPRCRGQVEEEIRA